MKKRFGAFGQATQAFFATALAMTLGVAPALAVDGPYVGMEVGASVPTNDNYRAHAEAGVMGSPFVGYVFNDYLGLQFNFSAHGQPPDTYPPRSGVKNYNEWTTLLGYTVGPRLQLPFGDDVELYALAEGGGFTGVSGRLTQTSPGFLIGGGLDYYLTDHVSVGAFGRWNRAYQAPRPVHLQYLVPEDQGPQDAEWAVGGITMKYRFNGPEKVVAPPPPPPPVAQAPPPPPPVKKKIILRGVNFDFDKASIRPDAARTLDEAAATLKESGEPAVLVIGHTDSVGSDAYNQKLSEKRATSVKGYLVRKGLRASQLTTRGAGESQPVAPNETADGRAQNRRVELIVQ